MLKKREFKKKFLKSGIDGFLITDPTDVRYLSGFTGSSGFIVITRKDAVFVTDFRYEEQARAEVKGFQIRIQRGDRAGEIRKINRDYGIKRVGFEDHNVSFAFFNKMRRIGIKL